MNIALFHNLPGGGGAIRVLAEYVAHSPDHDFTLYTRREQAGGLVQIDPRIAVRSRPYPETPTRMTRLRLMYDLPRLGRELAAEIDAAGHDVVLCFSSDLIQAPEVLPHLRTPSLYYAPESLRIAYEDLPDLTGARNSLRTLLNRWGLDPYERRRRSLDRRDIRAAPNVVTHSRFTADTLAEVYGVNAEVVHLGVDSDVFAPADVPREGFVLSVGALEPLKGHQFVIEALATLPEPRPRLVVVGDRGVLEGYLRELAAQRGVELDLRHGIPLEEVVSLYRRAGVLACGQIREPFGLITLEAMATETAVVAVAEGGFLETVTDGVTGLHTRRDPAEFGAALRRVLDSPELAGRLGRAGRDDAVSRWTWDRTAREYDRLLERSIQRAAPRR